MNGRWRTGLTALVVGAGLLIAGAGSPNGLMSMNPFWFREDYTSLDWTNTDATTASVQTQGSGTLTLPRNEVSIAFSTDRQTVLIGSSTGAMAWTWDGVRMVRAPSWDVTTGSAVRAMSFLEDGDLVVADQGGVNIFGWSSDGWRPVASLPITDVVGVAAGVDSDLLIATGDRFFVYGWTGQDLRLIATAESETGLLGIAAEPGGGRVAVWTDSVVRIYGWAGNTYRRAPTWEIPDEGAPSPILGMAFQPGGYWVWSRDGVRAYAFNGSYVVAWPALDLSPAPDALALAPAWSPRSFALLAPAGYRLWEWSGVAMREVPDEEVWGLSLGAYQDAALYQSQVLALDHDVSELQVKVDVPDLPEGTSLAWSLSTDGGATWLEVPVCMNAPSPADCGAYNVPVPPGRSLVYRIALSTKDPGRSPVVDATEIAEIVTVRTSGQKVEASLVR